MTKRGIRILVLGLLSIVLGVVVYMRVLPRTAPPTAATQAITQTTLPAATPSTEPAVLSRASVLADGSFNPLPLEKLPPESDPADLLAAVRWRERYRPLLEQLAAPPGAPGIYVYPFLDRTPQGVGLEFTYGWRLVGAAALARWTDARLAGDGPPPHYGLPLVDPHGVNELPTVEAWMRQALEEPAAAAARYVITGVYDFDPQSRQYSFEVRLLDREAIGEPMGETLWSRASAERGTFEELAETQRAAARQLADRLIEKGIAKSRRSVEPRGISYDDELAAIAALLDANDTWAVMDGVDRALQLAQILPDSTAPLQAAAYGIIELLWTHGFYGMEGEPHGRPFTREWLLRAFSLSQVAMASDPGPEMSRLNWIIPARWTGQLAVQAPGGASDLAATVAQPELEGYRSAWLIESDPNKVLSSTERLPDWLVLRLEARQSWYVKTAPSLNRDYFSKRLAYWESRDFYFRSMLLDAENAAYHGREWGSVFEGLTEIGMRANRFALSRAWAAMLATLAQSDAARPLLDQSPSIMGVAAQEAGEAARGGDYYALRALGLRATRGWREPYRATDASYRLIEAMQSVAAAVDHDPALTRAPSGYPGFEFTPAERARFLRSEDYLGTFYLARKEGRARAVYDALIVIVENYLRLRPDNAEARKRYVELLEGSVEGSDRAARQFSAVTDFYRLHPIEPYTCILMANQCFDQELDKAASILLETAARLNPFSPFNDHEVGMCYRRNSYNAKAVEYLAKFMEAVPTRSDVAIEWAWSMCEMGHYKEPRVREAFAAAVGRYSGNAGFQVHNIDYLLYWAKDREAALQAAENLYAIFPTANYLDYQFRIALADGQTTRALDLLRQMKPEEGAAGLSLSAHHAAMVERYLQVNRADLARPHLEIAMSIDSWQQPVIRAMGNMAYAEGNFEQAMAQYERALDRYEFNPETVTAIAACLDKLGRPQEAAERLERDFLAASHPLRANLVPSLLYFMADAGDLNKMDGFLDALVRSRGRTRALVWQAVEAYRKIDPKFSEAVWADIDRIMAAPDYTLPAHGDGATSATGGAGAADPSSGERSDN